MNFKNTISTLLFALFSFTAFAAELELRFPTGSIQEPSYTYDNVYGAYSVCDLFNSTQSRAVACTRDDAAVVDGSFCEVPITSQSCAPNYTYTFNYSAYGVCDLFTSTQSRTSQCIRDHDSLVVADGFCGAPITSQSCTPAYTYSFSYDAWGTCDPATSTQSRSSQCLRDHDSLVVADGFCGTAISSQSCTPAYTYTTSYSSYGSCSGSPLTKTRTASCSRDYDSIVVSNSFCSVGSLSAACSASLTSSVIDSSTNLELSATTPVWVFTYNQVAIPGVSGKTGYLKSQSGNTYTYWDYTTKNRATPNPSVYAYRYNLYVVTIN